LSRRPPTLTMGGVRDRLTFAAAVWALAVNSGEAAPP